MNIHVFLLCYNESILLPNTIKHYKKYLPSCNITIYDNESTDNSVEIAKSLGCHVIRWSSDNMLDEFKQTDIKNNCWKHIKSGWIIMADMDEYLCVDEKSLLEEMNNGTTILTVKGIDMIGESKKTDLSDINLQDIKRYISKDPESKNLCFLREQIIEMNYGLGAHTCNPVGTIKFSSKTYYNKHMSILGLKFLLNKTILRHERSHKMRSLGISFHYINDIQKIKNQYYDALEKSMYI